MNYNKEHFYFFVCTLILSFLILSPVLDSGYISDDELNSLVSGVLLEEQTDIISVCLSNIDQWLTNEGRFFPISFFLGNFIFCLNPPIMLYKLFLIITILTNTIVFSYLIWQLTKSTITAIFLSLLLPIFFKVSFYHCPILSFNGLVQITYLLFLLSLIVLLEYLKNQNKKYLMLSLFLYLFCILTYEIAIPLLLIHFILIFYRNNMYGIKHNIRITSYYIIIAFLCVIIPKVVQSYRSSYNINNTSMYSINLNFFDFAISLAKEISGVIPLTVSLFSSHSIFHEVNLLLTIVSIPLLFCIGVISFILFYVISKKYVIKKFIPTMNIKDQQFFFFLGICLILCPLIATSITYKHQLESHWGLSYLPGYISAYGACICTVCLLYYLFSKFLSLNPKVITLIIPIFSLIFSLICMVTFLTNSIVVEYDNLDSLYPRQIAEESLDNGLFCEIPNNSFLFIDDNHKWDQPSFYRMYSGLHFKYIASPGTPTYDGTYTNPQLPQMNISKISNNIFQYSFSEGDNVYYFKYNSTSKNYGNAILCKLNSFVTTDRKILRATTSQMKIYVKSPVFINNNKNFKLILNGSENNNFGENVSFQYSYLDLTLNSNGDNWKLFSKNTPDLIIDPLSINITVSQKVC